MLPNKYLKKLRARLARIKRDLTVIDRNCRGSPEACREVYETLDRNLIDSLCTLYSVGNDESYRQNLDVWVYGSTLRDGTWHAWADLGRTENELRAICIKKYGRVPYDCVAHKMKLAQVPPGYQDRVLTGALQEGVPA